MDQQTEIPVQNTSGQGNASIVPPEAKGWSWGAFGFNWLWGVCNGTYIALLALIPGVNVIMYFVLGVYGREWAWRNRRWDSLEHFQRVQKTWSKVWVILFFIGVGLAILGLFFLGALVSLNAAHHAGNNSLSPVPAASAY